MKWSRLFGTPLGVVAASLLAVVLLTAVLGPIIWGPASELTDSAAINQQPSAAHLLGTDALGRDILARVLVATRLSVTLALLATMIGVAVGTLLGAAPSVLPRWAGRAIAAVVNVAVAFPGLLLALALAMVFGVGTVGAVLALGLAFAPEFARLTQTLAASVAGRDFIDAARVSGVGRMRILVRHILPNIGEPLVVNGTIAAGSALLAFAGLSFLGIGVQAPQYDWGRLLQEGLRNIYVTPAAALGTGLAIVIAGLAFSFFGEAAAAVIGVRTRHARVTGRMFSALAGSPSTPSTPHLVEPVLEVERLQVAFPGADGWVHPVRGVSLSIAAGESVGVVGESGSGKSMTALAIAQLIEQPGRVTAERLTFCGTPLQDAAPAEVRALLGTSLSMVFQDPMSSLNPTMRVGRQLAEVAEQHGGMSRRAALARAIDRLRAVQVPKPEQRAHQYPHEFSGGMRQRAMIGMGLMGAPRLVIADEPTTALDVTVQKQVLQLLAEVRTETGAALLLISHDLAVVSEICDRMLVMYAGRIVEDLPTENMHERAQHPYTRALLAAAPDLTTDRRRPLATIEGRPPEPREVGVGCAFANRCPVATARCTTDDPALEPVSDDQKVACWNPIVSDASPRAEGSTR